MLKRYQNIVGGIFRLTDAGTVALAWGLAYYLRFTLPLIQVTRGFPSFRKYAALTPLVVALWMVVFSSMRVYHSRRMLSPLAEAWLLLKAHGAALLLFIALTYLFSEYKYSRGVMLYFGAVSGVSLLGFRFFLRSFLKTVRARGHNLRHVIGIGDGRAMATLVRRIEEFPELGLRMLGLIVEDPSQVLGGARVADHLTGRTAHPPILGDFSRIAVLLKQYQPDQLFIALSRSQSPQLEGILSGVAEQTLDIQLIPDILDYVTLGCKIEDFEGLPVVHLHDSPLAGWGAINKRLMDVLLVLIVLVVLAPLFVLIAVLIKWTSPGPVFYTQERMGLDGKNFQMIKFRSMAVDAEQQGGAVWAQPNDQRRTRLGALLRGTSLDELPQFWNVLRGDMAIVGPRPERPLFVAKFRQEIPHYMLRHKVKAGITGWAQVHGWRGNTSLDRRIECDLFYIRNWSYGLDLKIMLLTVWRGFIHKNAY